MANKNKVSAPKAETQIEEVVLTTPDETTESAPKAETLSEDTDILESDEQKAHREEVQSRTFVEGQFTVKANLKHNGKLYKAGDSITLEENESNRLLADGTIE